MAPRTPSHRFARPAYLIVGEDSYLRTCQREAIIAASVPEEARVFAVAQFSLQRTPLAEVLARAATRPLLSPHQVLILSDVEGLDDEQLTQLEEYFAAPADFTVLVFEAEKVDRRTRLWRLLEENCEVLSAASPEGGAAEAEAVKLHAREFGVALDPQAVEELTYAVGNDQGLIRNELVKLQAYVGGRRAVTAGDVAAVVTPARQFSVFDLADLLAERRRPEALARLRQLLEAGESPMGIVGLLAWLYRQLLQAQALPRDTPAWKVAQVLRAPRARVEGLLRQARRFPPDEVRRAFAALLDADVALKSSPPNPAAVVEMLIARLTAVKAEEERL